MIYLENEQVKDIILQESFLIALVWANEGKDIELAIDWLGQEKYSHEVDLNNSDSKLVFEWVTDLEMNLKYPSSSIGPIELGELDMSQEGSVWDVCIGSRFSSGGLLRFKCNDVHFYCIERSGEI